MEERDFLPFFCIDPFCVHGTEKEFDLSNSIIKHIVFHQTNSITSPEHRQQLLASFRGDIDLRGAAVNQEVPNDSASGDILFFEWPSQHGEDSCTLDENEAFISFELHEKLQKDKEQIRLEDALVERRWRHAHSERTH